MVLNGSAFPNGLRVPGWAVAAITAAATLVSVGAAAGVKAHALAAKVGRSDSVMVDHLLWAADRNTVLDVVLAKVDQADAKLSALARLKCLEARDTPRAAERRQALDRLALSEIDCDELLANRVPGR